MGLFPFNGQLGQTIQGQTPSVPALKRVFEVLWTKTPVVAAAADLLALTAQPSTGTTVVTVMTAQPDVARNVSCVGSQVTCTGNLVIAGTNLNGDAITETLAINGTTTVVGAKAFKTITSVTIPARGASGDTVSVGSGSKLGLHHKLARNTVAFAFLNKVKEGTAPTVAVSATALESNTVLLNSAIPGAQAIDIYYKIP